MPTRWSWTTLTRYRACLRLGGDGRGSLVTTTWLRSVQLFELDTSFAAAPDVFPPDKFNAGVLVLQPSGVVFQDMLSKSESLPSYDGGDTGFLNAYFGDWFERPASSRLSFGYNAQRTLFWFTHTTRSGYWESIQPLKIIHYSSSPKPWDCSPDARRGDLEALWWKENIAATMPTDALAGHPAQVAR